MTSITYEFPDYPAGLTDNAADVLKFIGPQSVCNTCGGRGEYEGPNGPTGCQPCCSRLIRVDTTSGVDYADWGDSIMRNDDGTLTVIHKK